MMAGRKKVALKRTAGDGRAFAVVVEQLRGDFRVFGEALAGLTAQVRAGFEEVGRRFGQVDERFDRVERDVTFLKTAVTDNGREIKAVRVVLDRKVDRDEVEGIVERVVDR